MKTMTLIALSACLSLLILIYSPVHAKVVEYDLTIDQQRINITGRNVLGMTINGNIPGPTLAFTEGDVARIQVHNRMPVSTSIHWHGVLVPPGMDGVPNLSFPPIEPGTTFTYEFPIRQNGTYWYHSHSGLQEQSGVYGSIVIHPSTKPRNADRDHVVLFSDWTDEPPTEVLRTLQRGSEWYALQKGSGQSVLGAAKAGMLNAYFTRELQRMPPMDIADVAYDRFLANGQPETILSGNSGETLRLRLIDGSATTYFHLEYAGGPMKIVAADGIDVVPFEEKRLLIGVAETYDVLVKIPDQGAYELRATAHDGSGFASVWIGSGKRKKAPDVPKPNLYMGMGHASLDRVTALTPAGSMGMSDKMVAMGHFDKPGMMAMGHMDHMEGSVEGDSKAGSHGEMSMPGMQPKMETPSKQTGMTMTRMQPEMGKPSKQPGMAMPGMQPEMAMPGKQPYKSKEKRASQMTAVAGKPDMDMVSQPVGGNNYGTDFRFLGADIASRPNLAMDGSPERSWPPYDKLRATKSTSFDSALPVRTIRLTLDGDMERYVWLLNNKALSESDVIRIREGEVVRFVMINRTMMHHPMHLHGHFFRVLNSQGDHAPLKHTVNVAPMSTTVIEFAANEVGDWFFHCHLLYHMKAGMARSLHYDNYTPPAETAAVQGNLFEDHWTGWVDAEVLSNMTEGMVTLANTRNIFRAQWEIGWQDVNETEIEGILSWDYYLNRFLTVFAGLNLLGEADEVFDETRGVAGLSYLLPLNLESRAWVDTDGGARISLEKALALTPRWELIGEVEYDTHEKWEGKVALHYTLTQKVSLVGQWHSEFGWGGGLEIRF